jgi:alpha-ketoglutarate-dependent taurine dioxygenase
MKKLPAILRRSVKVSAEALVTMEPLCPGRLLPLLVGPKSDELKVDLLSWVTDERELLEAKLLEHGGILFRGFGVSTTEQLDGLIRAFSGQPLDYLDRATPRSQVSGKIFSSTDYPPDQTIELHNENCYASAFPGKIFFLCQTPAHEGGATPIADCREVYRLIAPDVRERFARRGVMYVRNFVDGLGLSWQDVFQTADREEMARFCRASGIEVEWRGPEHLRTRQVRPALARHPRTGEMVWFNQAVAFHVTTLEDVVRESLVAELSEEGVPKNAFYGDGAEIAADDLEAVREAHRRATFDVQWRAGDLLVLDNLLSAHGRRPYSGPRKVVVGMAELLDGKDVWVAEGEPR